MAQDSRIVIAARDATSAEKLSGALTGLAGISVSVHHERSPSADDLHGADAVLAELQDEASARKLTEAVRELPRTSRPGLLLVLPEDDDTHVELAVALRVNDFVRIGAAPLELRSRVHMLLRNVRVQQALARKEEDAQVTLELTQVLASSLEFHEILFTLVRRLAETMRVDRVSMVLVDELSPWVGHVVAASDDYHVTNLALDLAKYPEIQQTLRTRAPLAIDDVDNHPVLEDVRTGMPSKLSALFLFPIVWQDSPLGVLFLRTEAQRTLTDTELDFCRVIANASAVALRNARVLQQLKHDHKAAVTQAHTEAEQRAQALKAYEDLFASAPDGIAVFSLEGGLLFANPKTYDMLGYREDELHGRKLHDILAPASSKSVREVWRKLAREGLVTDIDLMAHHKFGRELTLSGSFSVLDDGSVLAQFRDVTSVRATAAELRKTKEFLESLIDASVDAIVAADLTGTIILFNKGAERIYGYPASDVVGKRHVSCLYPEGVAKEVMRKIRCPEFGGEGRLQSMHSCAVNRDGQMIPISLSAAMIYESHEPIATVGIFTDLREKILAEERLAQAQKKLEVSEKQALLAELAGTAAHELNQPLTSVMGYGELLSRRLPEGSAEQNAAQVIVRETERMADLVRKIGRITRYETKSYVGDQRILDLEKASDEEL